jgi:hypothetical protein
LTVGNLGLGVEESVYTADAGCRLKVVLGLRIKLQGLEFGVSVSVRGRAALV